MINTYSNPTDLIITDMRFVDIDGAPKRCTILKIMTPAATARANRRSCGCSRARFSPTAARSSWARRSASGIFRRRGASWT